MLAFPTSRQALKGEVWRDGFRVAQRISYPNGFWAIRSAFQTWASGAFVRDGNGTTVTVRMFVHPGVIAFWVVVGTLCAVVGLAAVTNTLQGGWGLVLVPGSFGLLSLLPRAFAIGDGPYLLRLLKTALEADWQR
jgi:hypothetical protein